MLPVLFLDEKKPLGKNRSGLAVKLSI